MKAMIMAAGVGSRLMPLTATMPKPMVPILGKPVMEHGVNLLKQHGVTQIISNLHYLPDVIRSYFANGQAFGVEMDYSYEETLMGTAGGVKNNQYFLETDTFVILSGDALTDINLSAMYEYHKSRGALATIALKSVEDVSKFGVVIQDSEGRITAFQEKPKPEIALSNLANTGIYIFEPHIFELIPANTFYDFGKQLFPLLVEQNLPFFGWETKGYWSDIGSFETYKEAQFDMINGKVKLNTCKMNSPFYIGRGSVIASSSDIEGNVVIGENTAVGERCTIYNSVILDNVTIGNDITIINSVIGNGCRINDKVVINSDCVLGDENVLEAQVELLQGVKIWPRRLVTEIVKEDLVG
ncbi:MAG: NDP-sugar synthase [Clostridia bacterium]|jgi:mannose-1-phosphate guanylyltransferase/mannose-1-phosphate guanylyltransferase/phosphomannomutase|nr:NDP-sugar synthase [Clostridia bacterium]